MWRCRSFALKCLSPPTRRASNCCAPGRAEMISNDAEAAEFARHWEAAWNRRDVEAVLAHFAEDVVFTSPVAQQIGFARSGIIQGKSELRRYWLAALEKN